MQENIKVLILSCGTGGGHNSAALAIKENLNEKGIDADFVEYLDIINKKIKNGVNKLYINSTKGQGRIFKKVYRLGELYSSTKLISPVYGLNRLNKKKLYKYIVDNGYNYMITTHLFAAQALTAIKKVHNIHFIAVATDYVCIPFWEETNPDFFIIPSEDLEEEFIKKNIPKEKLLPYGIPVAKCYRENEDKITIKEKLGLKKERNYILILTGSMGFGKIKNLLDELLTEINDVVFIVACGNNKKMREEINEKFLSQDRVISLPFTQNIAEYIKSSEIVLTKPGGLTTTELATLRKPFIHTMPIPGCENFNADYFESKGMSIKSNTIEEVVLNTKMLYENKELQEKMIQNQMKYISKDTCDKISNIIIKR